MSKEDLKIADLIFSYIKGELTESQTVELARWMESCENNKELFERLVSSAAFSDKREIYSRFEQYYNYEHVLTAVRCARKLRMRRIAAVAAVLVVAAGTTFFLNYERHTDSNMVVYDGVFGSANRAVLTLGNGQSFYMDTVGREFLEEDGSVMRLGTGEIAYDAVAENRGDVWHSISIPHGGEYMIRLADGTRVWLNSASTLNYPLNFPENERRVVLCGEAYFEVAHDGDKPFVVESDEQRVVVLGTEFNVKAYEDEQQILTTLIEGSVEVKTAFGEKMILIPGNQSRLNKGSGNLSVRTVETDEVTAWKEGLFVIEEQTLEQVLRQLARWYDVDFIVGVGIPENMTFKGNIPKYQDIGNTLKRLEMISNLKMKINGKTVKVSK